MENGELASNLIRKAIKARDAREAARKARDESRNGKKTRKTRACCLENWPQLSLKILLRTNYI